MPNFLSNPTKRIKNIVFDFGNVLLDIDIPKTEVKLLNLMGASLNKPEITAKIWTLIFSLETNEISEVDFRNTIRKLANRVLLDKEIDNALNGMLNYFPSHRFKLLEALKMDYKLYLLSNTNSIHIRWVHQYLNEEYGIKDFEKRYFEKVYYSHLVGLRKPGKHIYYHVLSNADINPNESLFIDDNAENVETANKIGIHTILHDPKNDIGEVLKNVGIIDVND